MASTTPTGPPTDGDSLMRLAALVTANFGGIDELKPLPPRRRLAAYYYTDGAGSEPDAAFASTWTRILHPEYPLGIPDPRLRARYFKLQIHHLPESRRFRWLLWADARVRFKDLSFIKDSIRHLSTLSPNQRALLVPHPDRNTIEEEYEFIRTQIESGNEYLSARYRIDQMTEQLSQFRRAGKSLTGQLWAGGFWMVENSDLMRGTWDLWHDYDRFPGNMDQLSLPVALNQHHIRPTRLEVNLYDNAFFSIEPHKQRLM